MKKNWRTRSKRFWLGLSCLAWLNAGALVGCALPAGVDSGFQTESQPPGVVADYLLKVSESFGIKSVEPAHQDIVNAQVKSFEADLSSGQVDPYYQNPSFSILLAAGSAWDCGRRSARWAASLRRFCSIR